MRGTPEPQMTMLSLRTPEERVPADHPIRRIKALADAALATLAPTFDAMYSPVGRPSIPPERLLKASLLIALHSVRSERLFCEQLDYNLLYRWFLDMDLCDPSFDHSTFSRNRQRLLDHDVAAQFFAAVVQEARRQGLLSAEHFSVDGTLIEAWASLKSLRRRDDTTPPPPADDPGNPSVDFRGERRANATHVSRTDPEARLARKGDGQAAKLAFASHVLMENRHGLVVDVRVTAATGTAERDTALTMLDERVPGTRRVTLGADKGYDTRGFVAGCRERNVTPHVTQNTTRSGGSAIDGRTALWDGYTVSQRLRKRSEEIFGWMKTIGGLRRTRFKGTARTQLAAYVVGAAYNLLRLARLTPAMA